MEVRWHLWIHVDYDTFSERVCFVCYREHGNVDILKAYDIRKKYAIAFPWSDQTSTVSVPVARRHVMARSAPIRRTSVYKDDVDFDALSMQDPGFAAIYNKSKGKLDFHDPSTLQYASI